MHFIPTSLHVDGKHSVHPVIHTRIRLYGRFVYTVVVIPLFQQRGSALSPLGRLLGTQRFKWTWYSLCRLLFVFHPSLTSAPQPHQTVLGDLLASQEYVVRSYSHYVVRTCCFTYHLNYIVPTTYVCCYCYVCSCAGAIWFLPDAGWRGIIEHAAEHEAIDKTKLIITTTG